MNWPVDSCFTVPEVRIQQERVDADLPPVRLVADPDPNAAVPDV